MDKTDELLERCFKCKDYPEDCGIYFVMSLWQKECKFFREKMTKYQQFLKKLEVISEEQFNKIVEEFPDVDIDLLDLDVYDSNTVDNIADAFVRVVLSDYDWVFIDNINFEERTISFEDVQSLEDLESIKERFSNWNITNYDEIKEQLTKEKSEDDERRRKMSLINTFIDNIPIEDLKIFISKYDNLK